MNAMHATRLMAGAFIAKAWRLWRLAGFSVRWVILGFLFAGGWPVAAQEPDVAAQTNDLTAAEVLAQISEMVQAAESGQLENMAGAEDLAGTNGLAQFGVPAQGTNRFERGLSGSTNRFQASSRSQSDDRRSRSRRSSKSKADQGSGSRATRDYSESAPAGAPAGTNGGLASLDYSAFKIIVDRNIFDPNRYPHRAGESRVRSAPKTVDSLILVGTMSYEKGWFAFFDGSSSEYKKALKLTDTIAGYKVAEIEPNGVKLAAGTNRLELKVGMQMRREDEGAWLVAGQSGSYVAAPTSTSTNAVAATASAGSDAASSAAESDIIKRLMQKRQQE